VPGLRTLVVWCPDWPLVAAGVPADEPAVVVVANRVVATSAAARTEGVAVGQRRREAQGRCPVVAVLERDRDAEARRCEPVAAALEALTPRVEVTAPGLVGFPTRGPSRYFGGDAPLADTARELVEVVLAGRGEARVGLADGAFAAALAARTPGAATGPVVVAPGGSPAFLAPLPVTALERPALTEVLVRLGLGTLGAFAALAVADVVGRFGTDGHQAHRLAAGEDAHPPELRRPAEELAVSIELDPPAERVDACAFAAKALADELHASLETRGLSCERVAVEVETEAGEVHTRLWRHEGALSAAAIAERARWQLDGWLHAAAATRPHGGVRRLTLIPDDVVPATGRQLGFWGADVARADRVTRAVARVQGLLGPDAVTVAEWRGGRGPAEQVRLVPAGAVDLAEARQAAERGWVREPWPGRIPDPQPAQVHPDPVPVEVLDATGRPVAVSGRGELSAAPAMVVVTGGSRAVVAWTGPWPADERWWDPATHRRRARLQVVLDEPSGHEAHLLVREAGGWALEASYR
jgi:protein ImuB